MNKEKEYLEDLDHYDEGMGIHSTSYQKCKERLIRLAKIDNAKPSEALKCLERVDNYVDKDYDYCQRGDYDKDYNIIKQTLLKAQELETLANEYDLQPSQIREALLVFCMMKGAGYKVSDIEKAQEQEKVLDVIKKKDVDIQRLMKCINVATYNNGLPKNRQLTKDEFELLRSVLGE